MRTLEFISPHCGRVRQKVQTTPTHYYYYYFEMDLHIIINRLPLHLYNIACDRSFDHVKALVTSHETDYGFTSQGN